MNTSERLDAAIKTYVDKWEPVAYAERIAEELRDVYIGNKKAKGYHENVFKYHIDPAMEALK